jgi:very-short-patch-repair endonuclease
MAELAARQHGVVARRQLAALGVSETMVRDRLGAGRLVRIHRGVYAVGHAQLRPEGRWLAAVLAVGPGAALSHRSAAALHGIRESDSIDVTTTRRVHVRGVLIHRTTSLDAQDVTTRRGVRSTTVARTLLDLATILPPDGVGKLLREMDRTGRLGAAVVRAMRDRIEPRRDAAARALRAALTAHERLATSLTRSELEDRFLSLLDAHDLPRPLTNHPIEGLRVDAVWLSERVVVECDGWAYHWDRGAFQEDRTRDARLTAAGWAVLRFTHADVVDRPGWVARMVGDTLAR